MSDKPSTSPVERAVELMVYAPIGLAMFAKDMAPPLINQFILRGRARVTELQQQLENQIGQARIMGQFAVAEGRRQVRHGVEERLTDARHQGERIARTVGLVKDPDQPVEPGGPAPKTTAAPVGAANGTSGNGSSVPRGDASGLPIPDYDELSASQVVARLSGLSSDDLAAVREYESSQRQRKTILTKIEQLTA